MSQRLRDILRAKDSMGTSEPFWLGRLHQSSPISFSVDSKLCQNRFTNPVPIQFGEVSTSVLHKQHGKDE